LEYALGYRKILQIRPFFLELPPGYHSTTMKPALEALVFDMDGLLLDTEPVYQRVWTDSLAVFGHVLTHQMFLQLLGRGRKGAFAKVAEIFGAGLDLEMLNTELSSREARYFDEAPLRVKPGVRELLAFAIEKSFLRVVATSTRRQVAEKRLASSQLSNFFGGLVGGDEVSNSKPAPDIFFAAAKNMNVLPARCVVLEDSEMGIRGAHAAGMIPVMVPDLLTPSAEIKTVARVILPNLFAVRSWIEAEYRT
jgi:HAD superfamily hydrolase (TIGR01509 family)